MKKVLSVSMSVLSEAGLSRIKTLLHNPADFDAQLATTYIPLARWILAAKQKNHADQTFIVGINGGQGSGKTTTTEILKVIFKEWGYNTAGFSIDDLYKSYADRQAYAAQHHPLFASRGVPGTHDIELGIELFDQLRAAGKTDTVAIPTFDKSLASGKGDRCAEDRWMKITGPVDIVLFEGWCVGAKPLSESEILSHPNTRELTEDTDGTWRKAWNKELAGPYAKCFGLLDHLIMLKVPSMDTVFRNREEQEERLRQSALALPQDQRQGRSGMTKEQIVSFVQLFQRLTEHMLGTMPVFANLTLQIDDNHRNKTAIPQL